MHIKLFFSRSFTTIYIPSDRKVYPVNDIDYMYIINTTSYLIMISLVDIRRQYADVNVII